MAKHINGINPDILKWARERSGYTVERIAAALKEDASIVNDWESGERALTYVQLEKLADKYERPIALFFFSEPPDEPNIAENLALRSSDNTSLEPHIHILLREAYARQLSLMELNAGTNPAKMKIFRDLQARPNDSAMELAQLARACLNVDVTTQAGWNTPGTALEKWRDCIEDAGIFVFKDAFQDDSVDGFCLVHEEFPVIYLNNSRAPVRQIFSLFHELAHLLLDENGITRSDDFHRHIFRSGTTQEIEDFCDRFAGEFLVPSNDFETHLNFANYDDKIIEELANYYKVSRPVILLKLVKKGILTQEYYWEKIDQWTEDYKRYKEKRTDKTSPGGGSYYNTRATYLGYRFMELAFGKYHDGRCSVEQLAEHLNVKVKHLPQLEDCLLRRALR
ncbi:hypothetical protein C6499_04305 [Candidatus Poribacteria bacterium]|nr:MAG: hypothetical protein C6499_04305 [Candidatus Poribacteria bacterium]